VGTINEFLLAAAAATAHIASQIEFIAGLLNDGSIRWMCRQFQVRELLLDLFLDLLLAQRCTCKLCGLTGLSALRAVDNMKACEEYKALLLKRAVYQPVRMQCRLGLFIHCRQIILQ